MPNENIYKAERNILNYNSLDTYMPSTVTITCLYLKRKRREGDKWKEWSIFPEIHIIEN